MISRLTALASLAIAAHAIVAAPAPAALPKTSDHLILINRSIGGVGPGSTMAEVKRLWGPEGAFGEGGADYPEPGNQQHDEETGRYPGGATVLRLGRRAYQVGISTALQETSIEPLVLKPVFGTPLSSFQTKAGVRLGSPGGAVAKAYPQARAKQFREGAARGTKYRITAKDGSYTEFVVRGGRVSSIVIEARKFEYEA